MKQQWLNVGFASTAHLYRQWDEKKHFPHLNLQIYLLLHAVSYMACNYIFMAYIPLFSLPVEHKHIFD